jgi:hypothetical protein
MNFLVLPKTILLPEKDPKGPIGVMEILKVTMDFPGMRNLHSEKKA